MKKLLALVLAIAMLLPVISIASAEDVTLTYACFSAAGAQEETLKSMISVFESKNPGIKIDVQLTGYADYFTALATKVAGGNAPDVFEMNMENFLSYMLRGQTADLSGLGINTANYSAGTIAAAKTKDAMLTTRSLPQRFRASPTQSAAKIDPAPNAARQRP